VVALHRTRKGGGSVVLVEGEGVGAVVVVEEEGAGVVCGGGGGRGGAVVAATGGRGRPRQVGPTCQREEEKGEGVTACWACWARNFFYFNNLFFMKH